MMIQIAHRAAIAVVASAVAFGVQAQQSQGTGSYQPSPQQQLSQSSNFAAMGLPSGPGYVDLDGGLTYTDNARLSSSDRVSDVLAMAGVDMNFNHQGGKLTAQALGQVNWVQYLGNTYSGEPLGNLNGVATWGQPSDWFQWLLRETFGEGMDNPLEAPTPLNLEYVNYFTTGPSVNFNFGASNRLSAHALYSNVTYQSSPYDSGIYDGGASFTHGLSAASSVSLQADVMRTNYTGETVAPDYDTRTASASFQVIYPRSELSVTAGYTEVNYTGSARGAPLFSLRLSHSLGAYSSVYLSGQSGYTTLGDAMRTGLSTPTSASVLAGVSPGISTPEPYRDEVASAGFSFHRARTTLSLVASVSRDKYEQVLPSSSAAAVLRAQDPIGMEGLGTMGTEALGPVLNRFIRPRPLVGFDQSADINNTSQSYSASITRQLRPTLSLTLQGYRTHSSYSNIGAKSVYTMVELSLQKQFRRVMFAVYAERLHVTSSGSANTPVPIASYDDDRGGFEVTYDLIGHRSQPIM